jgi:hypothetical protein
MEARIRLSLQHLVENDDFWSRVIFSDEKVFQSSPNGSGGSSEEATEAVPPQIKLNKKKIKNIILRAGFTNVS